MIDSFRITHPEQLEPVTRYRVRCYVDAKGKRLLVDFEDVLLKVSVAKKPIRLQFVNKPSVKWLDIVSIEKA